MGTKPENPLLIEAQDVFAAGIGRGLTLRDYFAVQAVIGLLKSPGSPERYARMAYAQADALLLARGES